ncbi:MAG: hypothetical protein Q7I92_10640 [Humidesulfovibrio sp.]|jgi:UDP-N-acetylmuramyl pentapeptide synthase|nr:hypothetical protein [Humidesulfovibrio sp.]PKN06843.1 MAG: hypothetical protein CVU73_15085 [Deltaproteobacteria bacterium HGW-Deltaproteobacteria-8]
MQKIPLSLVKPGMKLAKAITKANGMAIVGSGVELTEALIDRLDGMGIDRVFVVGDAVAVSQNPTERMLRLDQLFRRLNDDAYMVKVKAYLHEYFAIKAAADAAAATPGKG